MRKGACLLLVAACAAASAHATPRAVAHATHLTKAQADRIALKALHPQPGKRPIVLFGLPRPLGTNDWVTPADPPPSNASRQTYTRTIHPLGHRAWLYWEDLTPGAMFAHPSRLVLIDDRTGRIEQNVKLRWFPIVSGSRPAFLRSLAAYGSKRYRVFARLPAPPKRKKLRLPALAAAPSPDVFKNDCLILAGDFNEPIVKADFPAVAGFGQKFGLPVYYATSSGGAPANEPPPPGSHERPADGDDLAKNVRYLVTQANCKDVFIYLAGHGDDKGQAAVTSGSTIRNVDGKAEITRLRITSSDIADIAEQNPEAKFKIAIDSCFSGRFLYLLRGTPNIRVVQTSSAATEESFGYIGVQGEKAYNTTKLSEFTNGFLHGLEEFMTSDDEAKAEASGQSVLAAAVANAQRLGNIDDDAFQLGLTHPQQWVNGKPEPKPLPFSLVQASHTHPPGATLSFVCVKVKTEPGASIHVTVGGAGAVVPDGQTVTADANGDAIVSFFINTPGEYIFFGYGTRLSDGAVENAPTLVYDVPPPPPDGAAQGPFECPVPPKT